MSSTTTSPPDIEPASLASANVMTLDLADRTQGTSRNTLLGIAQVIMLGELAVIGRWIGLIRLNRKSKDQKIAACGSSCRSGVDRDYADEPNPRRGCHRLRSFDLQGVAKVSM